MLWETFQKVDPLPALTPHQRELIAAFFDIDQDITELAALLKQDLFETVTQLQDPVVAPWIAALITLKNNERRERALRTLDAALTNDHNPSTIRRAASRILRHFELTRPPHARPPRAIEVDRCATTSMRAAHDVESPNVPPSTTRKIVQKTTAPTPDPSESSSKGPGQCVTLPAEVSSPQNTDEENKSCRGPPAHQRLTTNPKNNSYTIH